MSVENKRMITTFTWNQRGSHCEKYAVKSHKQKCSHFPNNFLSVCKFTNRTHNICKWSFLSDWKYYWIVLVAPYSQHSLHKPLQHIVIELNLWFPTVRWATYANRIQPVVLAVEWRRHILPVARDLVPSGAVCLTGQDDKHPETNTIISLTVNH
jgi:hypothetical protein